MSLSKLESAAMVYWGEEVDSDECHLGDQKDNPESQYMMKELLENLSSETKLMMKTIMELPDEVFYKNGKIILRELYSYMRRRYQWNVKKVDKSRLELAKVYGKELL
jgi:hypothetical protein